MKPIAMRCNNHHKQKKQQTMKPIAMHCNKQQFEEIKPLLIAGGLKLKPTTNSVDYVYLTNNYDGEMGCISNINKDRVFNYNRTVFEEWNKEKFLEYCDIIIIDTGLNSGCVSIVTTSQPITQDPKETAIRLVNIFTMYGFIKDEDSSDMMVTFAKFAAGQHLLEISTPELSKEDLAFNMQVMKEIRDLEISYPL